MKGSIKAVFESSGYGFIQGNDGVSYFFHTQDLDAPAAEQDRMFQMLAAGDQVDFDVVVPQPAKGARARSVRVTAPVS